MTFTEFGQELRNRRLERNISLSDIAADTRINHKFLDALEAGQFNLVPQTYVRAFLREYATAVGLSPEDVIAQYASIRGEETTPARPASATLPTPPGAARTVDGAQASQRSLQQYLRPAIFGAFVLVVVVVAWLLLRPSDAPVPPSTTSGEIPFDRVIRENEAVATAADSVTRPRPAPAPAPRIVPAVDSLMLEMTTSDSVWVNMVLDTGAGNDYLFAPNRRRTWKARERFVVTMGNAGGATFRLNGKDLGTLGRRGAVVRNSVISADLLR